MFFVISKIAGILTRPWYLALTLLLLSGALRLARRTPRLRRAMAVAAGVVLLVFSMGPTANLLLYPLESRYSRPAEPLAAPEAIVLLGGMTARVVFGAGYYELSQSSDRLVEAVRQAHRYPRARIVVTGGSAALIDRGYLEAEVLGRLVLELGIPARRLELDRDARNTHENAVNTARLLRGATGPVLLITSAAHMPRAVACFEKQGLRVVPWPVDFQRTGSGPGSWVPKPETIIRSTAALHELAGWAAYWLAGYI